MLTREEVFAEWEKTLKEISEAREQLAHINTELQNVKAAIAQVEAQAYLEVSQEKDEKGKPVYSNESLRQSAQILRLASDEKYNALLAIQRKYEREREFLIARISNLKDRIDYFKALVGTYREG